MRGAEHIETDRAPLRAMPDGVEWRRLDMSPYRSYEVSSDGRVRRAGRELKGYVDRYGYRTVLLSYVGLAKRFKVHRLVCEAFHGAPEVGAECAHWDGNPLNNRAENLRWATHIENEIDKIRHGSHSILTHGGATHPCSRLTAEQVEAIRQSDKSSRKLAAEFGVNQSHIVRIKSGQRWATPSGRTGSAVSPLCASIAIAGEF